MNTIIKTFLHYKNIKNFYGNCYAYQETQKTFSITNGLVIKEKADQIVRV